jgi:hypothetical protein
MRTLRRYGLPRQQFQTNTRVDLLHSFGNEFATGILRVLFNFHVLPLGFDRAFLARASLMSMADPPNIAYVKDAVRPEYTKRRRTRRRDA